MTKYQKYCKLCGQEIEEIISNHTRTTRYHPMYGQKQFKRVWMRVCPDFRDLFSEHFSFETDWKWIDEELDNG